MRAKGTIGFGVLCAAGALAIAAPAESARVRPVIGKPVLVPAHPLSGKRFSVSFRVTRSDTHAPIADAIVTSRPKLDGHVMRHTDTFSDGRARVSLLVPAYSAGKTLRIKVIVQTPGWSAIRNVAFEIRRGEPRPSLSVADVSEAESPKPVDIYRHLLHFEVRLSAPDWQTVTVAYATHDGTAVAPGDYPSTSGTLTFWPYSTSEYVDVEARYDTEAEPDETFTLVLSSPVTAKIADGSATGTILANPPADPLRTWPGRW
jgi:hypothetical protein